MRSYKKIKIRPMGNRKTDPNVLDTVRGCVGTRVTNGGCYGQCYAAKMAKMSGVNFSVPVSMELDPAVLRRALRKVKENWIRIGVSGDPSLDWTLTLDTCKIIHDEGKVPVIITKGWHSLTDEQMLSMLRSGTILHVSCSGDDGVPMFNTRTKLMQRYLDLGGRTICRIISSAWTGEHAAMQERYMTWCKDHKINVLETPLRIYRTNPHYLEGRMIKDKMKKHVSPYSGKFDGALTAGRMFQGPDVGYCDTACGDCPNQCFTRLTDPRSHVPREVMEVIPRDICI